ncbi:MAG: GNAT family N-acetyltransferase [Pseudomonadota bacterium]
MKRAIRPIAPADQEAVVQLWKASWHSIGISNVHDDAVGHAALMERLTASLGTCWDVYVCEADGALAGMLAIDPSTHELSQLFVAPDHQGRGVGTALLAHARALMPGGLWLTAAAENTRARHWYERENFILERIDRNDAFDRDIAVYRWRPPR